MNYYLSVLKKYAVFSGRAQRAEYWYFFLFNMIIGIVLGMISGVIGSGAETSIGILGGIYSLAVFIPSIAVSVRRLHDTNHSGWWLLINLLPFIGAIILLVFLVSDSQPGQNQYGPNPKGMTEGEKMVENKCKHCGIVFETVSSGIYTGSFDIGNKILKMKKGCDSCGIPVCFECAASAADRKGMGGHCICPNCGANLD